MKQVNKEKIVMDGDGGNSVAVTAEIVADLTGNHFFETRNLHGFILQISIMENASVPALSAFFTVFPGC